MCRPLPLLRLGGGCLPEQLPGGAFWRVWYAMPRSRRDEPPDDHVFLETAQVVFCP